MLIVDRLLVSGIQFVLDKVASAVESEMNDVDRLREELLAAQMQFELGEIDELELKALEQALLPQIRELNERQRQDAQSGSLGAEDGEGGAGDYRVTGIDAEFLGEPTPLAEPELHLEPRAQPKREVKVRAPARAPRKRSKRGG